MDLRVLVVNALDQGLAVLVVVGLVILHRQDLLVDMDLMDHQEVMDTISIR